MHAKALRLAGCLLPIHMVIASCASYTEGKYYLIDNKRTSIVHVINNPEKYNRKPIEGEFYFSCKDEHFAFLDELKYNRNQAGDHRYSFRFRYSVEENEEYCKGEQPKHFEGTLITACAYTFGNCPEYYKMYIVK